MTEDIRIQTMRRNVISMERDSQDKLTNLYLHLLNVALSEADASTATMCGEALSTFQASSCRPSNEPRSE
jgi:hypothetical protein